MPNACYTHLTYLLYPHLCGAFILSQSSLKWVAGNAAVVWQLPILVFYAIAICGLCGNRQNQVYRAGQFGVEVDKWFGRWNSDDGN